MSAASWQELPLEKVADIHDNLREPVNAGERASRHGPYPYYGATGQVGWIDSFRQDGEYVLLGEDGAPFLDPSKDKAYLVSGKCWVNNHAHVLRGKDGICVNKFLLHALNGVNYRGYANGTTRLKLTQAAMRRLPIKLPPVDLQSLVVEKIEELFSDLDAGIAALKRAQANLKRYRAAVLKAAVEGRLTEQWRAERKAKGVATEPAAQLLVRILTGRRKKWEAEQLKKYAVAGKAPPKGWQNKYPEPAAPGTSGLPELPEGWCWANTEQLGEVQLGRQRSPKNISKDFPTKYLRAANLTEAGLDLSDVLDMEFTPREKETFSLKSGDLILSEASGSPNQVGKPAVWRNELEECCFQNTVIRLRPAEGLSEFLLKTFQAFYVNGVFARTATGVGINHLSAYKFAKIAVPLGPMSEQTEIVAQVEAKLSNIAQAETEIKRSLERAARLRQAILKRAFDGRLV